MTAILTPAGRVPAAGAGAGGGAGVCAAATPTPAAAARNRLRRASFSPETFTADIGFFTTILLDSVFLHRNTADWNSIARAGPARARSLECSSNRKTE